MHVTALLRKVLAKRKYDINRAGRDSLQLGADQIHYSLLRKTCTHGIFIFGVLRNE
jgi:hypothetical protein